MTTGEDQDKLTTIDQPVTAQKQSSQQLALTLFASVGATETIEDQATSIGFHRNNLFLDFEDLSLSARRAIDVAFFIAAEDPEIREVYDADLHYFKWLMGYSSRNHKHLRGVLREGQKAAVQVEDLSDRSPDGPKWVSVPLLGTVGMANSRVVFEIPGRLQPHIKNPASSHFLSLKYVFKGLYARILYDKLLPHVSLGHTGWLAIDDLRKWFELDEDSYAEFKRFKSKILVPSMDQIGEVTNLKVSMSTKNLPGTKKVGHISFRIQEIEDAGTRSTLRSLDNQYHSLRKEFGLNDAQIQELLDNQKEWTNDRINSAMEYTRHQIQMGKVKVPAGYFMKAIRGGYTLGTADVLIAEQQAAKLEARQNTQDALDEAQETRRKAENESRAKEADIGLQAFEEATPEQQEQLLDDFCQSESGKILAMRKRVDRADLKDMYQDDPEIRQGLGTYIALRAKNESRQGSKRAGRGKVDSVE